MSLNLESFGERTRQLGVAMRPRKLIPMVAVAVLLALAAAARELATKTQPSKPLLPDATARPEVGGSHGGAGTTTDVTAASLRAKESAREAWNREFRRRAVPGWICCGLGIMFLVTPDGHPPVLNFAALLLRWIGHPPEVSYPFRVALTVDQSFQVISMSLVVTVATAIALAGNRGFRGVIDSYDTLVVAKFRFIASAVSVALAGLAMACALIQLREHFYLALLLVLIAAAGFLLATTIGVTSHEEEVAIGIRASASRDQQRVGVLRRLLETRPPGTGRISRTSGTLNLVATILVGTAFACLNVLAWLLAAYSVPELQAILAPALPVLVSTAVLLALFSSWVFANVLFQLGELWWKREADKTRGAATPGQVGRWNRKATWVRRVAVIALLVDILAMGVIVGVGIAGLPPPFSGGGVLVSVSLCMTLLLGPLAGVSTVGLLSYRMRSGASGSRAFGWAHHGARLLRKTEEQLKVWADREDQLRRMNA